MPMCLSQQSSIRICVQMFLIMFQSLTNVRVIHVRMEEHVKMEVGSTRVPVQVDSAVTCAKPVSNMLTSILFCLYKTLGSFMLQQSLSVFVFIMKPFYVVIILYLLFVNNNIDNCFYYVQGYQKVA